MRPGQCFFCKSNKRYTRIVTPSMGFDHVACDKHVDALADLADETLNGGLRCNLHSSMPLKRGEPYPGDAYVQAKALPKPDV